MKYNRRVSRARAVLLSGVGVFALLQLGLAVVVESWWVQLRDPCFGVKVVALEQRMRNSEFQGNGSAGRREPHGKVVVMLGTSRTDDALRGSQLEGALAQELDYPVIVYNLGLPGTSEQAELLYLERLLDRQIRPDLLLIEVLPAHLHRDWTRDTVWIPPDRLSWRDWHLLHEDHLPRRALRNGWRETCALPWYAHRFAVLGALTLHMVPGEVRENYAYSRDRCGWRSPIDERPSSDRCSRATAQARSEYGPTLQRFELGGSNCAALRMLLGRCRDCRLPAVLVLMPEASEFRNLYPPAAWAQVQAFLDQLRDEFDVPLINARNWVADADFMDTHHVFVPGAKTFTERLGREVVLPFFQAQIASR